MKDKMREEMFKNHVATITKCGDITILDWKKPGTIVYAVRYIFDGYNMYVSGDLGSAVFKLTWKADVHSFDNINIHYFIEKLEAFSNEKYVFDSKTAIKELNIWKEQLLEKESFSDEDDIEEFEEGFSNLIESAEACSNKNEWAYLYVNDVCNEFIEKYDKDYWEWMYDIGDVINSRLISYLIGLQMASRQLKNEEKKCV